MPKASEKTLELNVGAEMLAFARNHWQCPGALLVGSTQRQEKFSGVDSFLALPAHARLVAFQFKAPRRSHAMTAPAPPFEQAPYRYQLVKEQHDALWQLAQAAPDSVHYAFPFYLWMAKVASGVPTLLDQTWFLRVADVPVNPTFAQHVTRTVRCEPGVASINPEYKLWRLARGRPYERPKGISLGRFVEWLRGPTQEGRRTPGAWHGRERGPGSLRLRVLVFQ